MIHPRDERSHNPRIQCVVCGKWKRLHTKSPQPPHGLNTSYFGGCRYAIDAKIGDERHLARRGNDDDVCEVCCHIECKRIAAERLTTAQL